MNYDINRFLIRGCLVGLVMGFSLSAIAAKIKVSPALSPPEAELTVTGQGFGVNELVTIFFDSAEVATSATSGLGSFINHNILVPSTSPPGPHLIYVMGKESGRSARAEMEVNTNWSQYGFDVVQSGFNSKENVLSPLNVSNIEYGGFYYDSRASVHAPPVIVDGVTYFGTTLGPTNESALQAVDHDGKFLWLSKLKGTSILGIAFGEGRVVTISNDGFIRAFKARNGRLLWQKKATDPTEIEDRVDSSPVVSGGVVYFSGNSGEILAYKLQSGARLWVDKFNLDQSGVAYTFTGKPIVLNGALIFNVYTRYSCPVMSICGTTLLYGVNLKDGSERWHTLVPTWISGITAINGKAVIAGGGGGSLLNPGRSYGYMSAIDSEGGKLVWEYYAQGQPPYCEPSVAYGKAYSTNGSALTAFDVSSGIIEWNTDVHSSAGTLGLCTKPIIGNGVVYLNNGGLLMVDAGDGVVIKQAGMQYSELPPIVVNGLIYTTYFSGITSSFKPNLSGISKLGQ